MPDHQLQPRKQSTEQSAGLLLPADKTASLSTVEKKKLADEVHTQQKEAVALLHKIQNLKEAYQELSAVENDRKVTAEGMFSYDLQNKISPFTKSAVTNSLKSLNELENGVAALLERSVELSKAGKLQFAAHLRSAIQQVNPKNLTVQELGVALDNEKKKALSSIDSPSAKHLQDLSKKFDFVDKWVGVGFNPQQKATSAENSTAIGLAVLLPFVPGKTVIASGAKYLLRGIEAHGLEVIEKYIGKEVAEKLFGAEAREAAKKELSYLVSNWGKESLEAFGKAVKECKEIYLKLHEFIPKAVGETENSLLQARSALEDALAKMLDHNIARNGLDETARRGIRATLRKEMQSLPSQYEVMIKGSAEHAEFEATKPVRDFLNSLFAKVS